MEIECLVPLNIMRDLKEHNCTNEGIRLRPSQQKDQKAFQVCRQLWKQESTNPLMQIVAGGQASEIPTSTRIRTLESNGGLSQLMKHIGITVTVEVRIGMVTLHGEPCSLALQPASLCAQTPL